MIINEVSKMSKANIMREAHRLAKTFTGNYRACFALALKTLYKALKLYNEQQARKKELETIQRNIRVLFDGSIDETQIILSKNTYAVKEQLKQLGFKFVLKNWVLNTNNYNETLEIAKKAIALY